MLSYVRKSVQLISMHMHNCSSFDYLQTLVSLPNSQLRVDIRSIGNVFTYVGNAHTSIGENEDDDAIQCNQID